MTKVMSAAYAAEGERLLEKVRQGVNIPYTSGSMSLAGMDCQGLCEYLLIECGVPKKECDLAGSNAHWRACVWRGTPEECTARFGRVPAGAWVFIVNEDDSGAPEKYRSDGFGDAYHMGVVLKDCAIHASASRGCVAESRFEGKTIRNGGWNQIGLPPWVDYGIDSLMQHEDAATDEPVQNEPSESQANASVESGLSTGTPVGVGEIFATVNSPNGNPVKLRKSASQEEPIYWLVNGGARVRIEKERGDWSLITAICTDGHTRKAYMMSAFLEVDV